MRLASVLIAVGFASAFANANLTLDFNNITHNSGINVAPQLSVVISDFGDGLVDFTFRNTAAIGSSITDVYFHDGSLLAIAEIIESDGVAFSDPADPSDLPGGNTIGFVTTGMFSADADAPHVMENGVNSAFEWLTVRFSLQGTQTFADVLSEIADGTLRLGMHIQSIDGAGQEDSDGAVNIIPTPGAGFLGVVGLCLVGSLRRRLS